jgi:hypothetical protein
VAGKIKSTEKSKQLIGTQACDLLASSIVLQGTMLLSTPVICDLNITMNNKHVRNWKEKILMCSVAFATGEREREVGHETSEQTH